MQICVIWGYQGTRQGSIPVCTRICFLGVPGVLEHLKNKIHAWKTRLAWISVINFRRCSYVITFVAVPSTESCKSYFGRGVPRPSKTLHTQRNSGKFIFGSLHNLHVIHSASRNYTWKTYFFSVYSMGLAAITWKISGEVIFGDVT